MLKFVILSLVLIVGISCQKRKAAPVMVSAPDVAQEQKNANQRVNEDPNGLAPTIYFVPILSVKKVECQNEDLKQIKNTQGETIARVCEADYKTCVQQGTCLLSEARGMRIVNFTTRRGKVPTFSENIKKECPYGLGAKDICLDPYFTVAADLNFHKLGDVIFVPSARGLQLPNGETHDGYFIVRDSGSGVKSENRFDFFTGFDHGTEESNVFKKLGLDEKANRFKHEKVADDIAAKVRTKRNYPKINKKQLAEANAFIKSAMAR